METNLSDIILDLAEKKTKLRSIDIINARDGKVSRQYVNKIINQLISKGKLVKGGSTIDAFYVLKKDARLATALKRIKRRLKNNNLQEHEVLEDIRNQALFFSSLKDSVQAIFNYAFSEMLNNAIEHSTSENIEVEVFKDKEKLTFIVNDFGIGVFRNIMQKRILASELEAIQDLLKGKTTTQPKAHSGEGIFFTSKVGDVFTLESYDYRLTIDNKVNDVFIGKLKPSKRGTRVIFSIALNSRKHLSDIFKQYQTDPEVMAFDKTEVQIKLYTMGTVHVSRSQARRVMTGLEKFRTVILDFDKVPVIGQGFADEVFRVFQSRHPNIIIKPINMNDAVQFMIDRVEKTQPGFDFEH